ncbi:zinc finger, GRF-type containing protein [Tanacetum coccineum]|uniref:Zinc finger, GRF-type containing protein n=1 Tax=Tanacetum coccineum TaxID=301880 RepID=A0ABQ4YDD0_9ASTR
MVRCRTCGSRGVIRTSWTPTNPGRRFFGCSKRGTNCGIIDWYDPPMCDRAVQIIPGLLRRINQLQQTIADYQAPETNVEEIADYQAQEVNVEEIAHYPAHAPNVENHGDYQREARRMKMFFVAMNVVLVDAFCGNECCFSRCILLTAKG